MRNLTLVYMLLILFSTACKATEDTGQTIYVLTRIHLFHPPNNGTTTVSEAEAQDVFNTLHDRFTGMGIELVLKEFEPHERGLDALQDPNSHRNDFLFLNHDALDISLLSGTAPFDFTQAWDVGSSTIVIGGVQEYYGPDWNWTTTPTIHTPILYHEVGHCFNLFHTHHGTYPELGSYDPNECEEEINNPESSVNCGDYVADTSPDPNLWNIQAGISWVTGDCELYHEFPNQIRDGVIYEFSPGLHNIMSYTNISCMNTFTNGQIQRMREYLLSNPVDYNAGGILVGQEARLSNVEVGTGLDVGGTLNIVSVEYPDIIIYNDIPSGQLIHVLDEVHYNMATNNNATGNFKHIYWENEITEFRLNYLNKTLAIFGDEIEAYYDEKYNVTFDLIQGPPFYIRDPWYLEDGVQHNEFHTISNGTNSSVSYSMFMNREYDESNPDSVHYTLRAPKYILESNSIKLFQGFECTSSVNIEVGALEETLEGYVDQYVNILDSSVPIDAEFINVIATGQEVTFSETNDVISMSTPPIIDLGNNQIQVFRRWVITSGSATIVNAEEPSTILNNISTDVEISVESAIVSLGNNVSISYNEGASNYYANAPHLIADLNHIYEFQSWVATNIAIQNVNEYSSEIDFLWESGNFSVTSSYEPADTMSNHTISVFAGSTLDIPDGAQYDFAEGVKIEVGGTFNIGVFSGISGELNTMTSSGTWRGIHATNSGADIDIHYTTIENAVNSDYTSGGFPDLAVFAATGDVSISNSTFKNSGSILTWNNGTVQIQNNEISQTEPNMEYPAISIKTSSGANPAMITNNTFINWGTGVQAVDIYHSTVLRLNNNIFYFDSDNYDNSSTVAFDNNLERTPGGTSLNYNLFYGYEDKGFGDIESDYCLPFIADYPQFANPSLEDYRLMSLSPARDAGKPDLGGDGTDFDGLDNILGTTDDDTGDQDPDTTQMDIGVYFGGYYYDAVPNAPSNLLVSGVFGSNPVLSWNCSSEPDVHQYAVYRSSYSAGPFSKTATVSSCSWTDYSFLINKRGDRIYYRVKAIDDIEQYSAYSNTVYTLAFAYKPIAEGIPLPEEYRFNAAYPNPFNPSTTIHYELPINSNVNIMIFDLRGQLVYRQLNQSQYAGYYDLQWMGDDQSGNKVSSGVYLVRIEVNGVEKSETYTGPTHFVKTQKIILMK